jgi:hypothetical protein
MHIIYIILIFSLVLFLYLHVYFQLKTSDDLEIYEIDNPSKDKLEEICDLRQPVLFQFQNERIFESCQRAAILDTYGAFDIKIRNVKQSPADNENNLYVPLAFSNALKVIKEDTDQKYLVENNTDFLEETGIIKSFKYNDAFLRPYMVANCAYDFLFAAEGTRTPFKYELNYRTYLLVTEGVIKVKLSQPKSAKYLYQEKDYENMEFRSPINPWQVQTHYKADFDKIKCLDLVLQKGQIVYIPAYWWYSIEFGKETSLSTFKYKTYMNTVAILPQLVMRLLQTQNVKRNTVAIHQMGQANAMGANAIAIGQANAMVGANLNVGDAMGTNGLNMGADALEKAIAANALALATAVGPNATATTDLALGPSAAGPSAVGPSAVGTTDLADIATADIAGGLQFASL